MPKLKIIHAKITKTTVDGTPPAEDGKTRVVIRDTELRGFNLLVLPSGVKSYRFMYRTAEGKKREPTIAKVGELTPAEARDKADKMRRAAKDGRDPLGEKQALRQAKTVADMLDAYLEADAFTEKTDARQAIDRGRIERHLKPLLGKRHLHLVTTEDIKKALKDIRAGKTAVIAKSKKKRGKAVVKGGYTSAKNSIQLLSTVFNWAMPKLVQANPCKGVDTGSDRHRDTILEGAADYARMFDALESLSNPNRLPEGEKLIRREAADAIRVLALTGARKSEIAHLRWRHVDIKAGKIALPPKEHKAGHKTGKPRVIALPAAAQAIIAAQPSGEPDAFVFRPYKGQGGAIELSRPWCAIRRVAKLPDGIGLHGLRHSFGSHLATGGASGPEIMLALGHHQLSTTARYIHGAEDARKSLAEKAAKTALAGLAVASGGMLAEVVPFPKGATNE